jgi:hypothetical protein
MMTNTQPGCRSAGLYNAVTCDWLDHLAGAAHEAEDSEE